MSPARRLSAGPVQRLEAFAVEDDSLQVCWASLGRGRRDLRVVDPDDGRAELATATVDGEGGPGAAVLAGLPPGRSLVVELEGQGVPAGAALAACTLAPPPGRLRCRIATVSDIHVGETEFGRWPAIRDRSGLPDEPNVRCARAAIAEALAWGADLLVVKGDLTMGCRAEELAVVADLLTGLPVPVVVLPGNHDGGNHRRADPAAELAGRGVLLTEDVAVVDLPGIRLVAVDTVLPGHGRGRIGARLPALTAALAGAEGGALVCLHHHPQRTIVPTHWPPGILGIDGHRFLDGVERANPATLVTSGHTHRHRRRRHGPVTITEVGSPKDYPGTWAGYAVHDGGIRQVVRRVADPDAIAWTERTRRMGLGQWGRWSPGTLGARCFSLTWPAR
ncbi:MAG: metallophosphoesterase family protein [Acidimicrobiales bacterium]|nr:metallophosphoesterase family protein [Acidimicrobiales bacterium]